MEGTNLKPPNNSGQVLRLEIKQRNANIKKRKVKTWSPQEDNQLVKLYEEYPKKWGIIACQMQDRNQNQCLHRYRRLSQLGAHKKIWSAEEDQTILSLIKKLGKNWKLLAQIIGTKTGKQIRQRFINKLDPKIKTDDWTDEEDRLILKYYSQVGSKWSQISKKLIGRPQNKIKNRFYSYIQKNYDIHYVIVDNCQMGNQNNKNKENSSNRFDLNPKDIIQTFENAQKSLKIEEYSQNAIGQRQIFKQVSNNDNKQKYQKSQKRKDRLKPRYSRFTQRRNQQNIYQDQNDQPIQSNKNSQKMISQKKVKPPQDMPSIKQLEDEFKIGTENIQGQSKLQIMGGNNLHGSMFSPQEKDQIFDSNLQLGQKFYIKSLIRVEDELGPVENRYRSIRDLVSNNEIDNHENELFYLSHN